MDHIAESVNAEKAHRPLDEETLERLLIDIREGKDNAFDTFLTLIQNTVLSFGIKICGRSPDVSDATQETLLAAFRSLRQTDIHTASALKVWLYKVAKNACLMMRRKSKFEPSANLSLEALLPEDPHRADAIRNWSSQPLEELLKSETIKTVREAIQKLPTDYRLTLVLRDVEQLSTKETAQVLDISEETVKIRLHRARLFLRKELEASFSRE